uniref:Putative reverse transcriptase n=1 Tax=Pleodorina starrii TaxID=330485 RepID=M9P836_9CHLO|nr:putative reverse transcriptase [Pleodorina starrii]AFY64375.1 putative reverse transcriptase [Pleodorina starrii]
MPSTAVFISPCEMCYKTLSRHGSGNGAVLSGNESKLSEGGYHKNCLQVISSTDKFMNLIYSHTVPPWTLALLLLMGIVGIGSLPESEIYLYAAFLGNASQATLKTNGLQGPNLLDSERNGTLALPDGRKAQGKRSLVVSQKTEGEKANSGSNDAIIIPHRCDKLLDLLHDPNDIERRSKLIHYIADLNTLVLAYEMIKSNPGNMTKGTNRETLDGISLTYLHKTSRELLSGTYKFTPARRIYIPKPGKTEKRPLTIASPREKVVQKAIEIVLNIIYDPMFLPTSHGFRPKKSTHSALSLIDIQFKGAAWFIEADITKCFDSIKHNKLMHILNREIKCQKTLALIKSSLKAGHAEMGGLAQKAIIGTPQGSVLSPLLCNIYLHELDKYMYQLSNELDKGIKRRQNPAYTRLSLAISKTENLEEKKTLRQELRKIRAANLMDPNFTRVRYVRYADDFLISVIGPHSLATEIKDKVRQFLDNDLDLQMNEAKTSITSATRKKAFFLGTYIQWRQPMEKKVVMTKKGKPSRITARMALLAPMDKLIDKLVARQFLKWNPNGTTLRAKGLTRMVNLDHADIIAYYNAVIRGILTYYSFADNRSSLGSIVRYLHMSCARTIALKYKLRYMSKAYKKFGSLLTCPDKGVSLYKPNTLMRIRQFNLSNPVTLEMLERSWANKLTKSNLGLSCVICGKIPAQMHHVRKIKELKSRLHLDWFTLQMAAINRKQVPLCQEHHTKLHQNKLTFVERDLFEKGCKKRG